jgi:hypothetical protein
LLLDELNERTGCGILKEEAQIALYGELAMEEAMDLS